MALLSVFSVFLWFQSSIVERVLLASLLSLRPHTTARFTSGDQMVLRQRILSVGSEAALGSRFSHGSIAREMGTRKKVQHLVRRLMAAPNACT